MTLREACNLMYDLEITAARCPCGMYMVCAYCESLLSIADAVGWYVIHGMLQHQRTEVQHASE